MFIKIACRLLISDSLGSLLSDIRELEKSESEINLTTENEPPVPSIDLVASQEPIASTSQISELDKTSKTLVSPFALKPPPKLPAG